MKQYLLCLMLLALVASISSGFNHQPPVPAAYHQVQPIAQAVAVPVVPVVAPPIVYPAGCANYLPLVQKYDWSVRTAMAVMRAENSTCDPSTTGPVNYDGTYDRGLFQINSIHADMVGGDLDNLKNPAINVAVAYRIYKARGSTWLPWSTYNNGRYLAYL